MPQARLCALRPLPGQELEPTLRFCHLIRTGHPSCLHLLLHFNCRDDQVAHKGGSTTGAVTGDARCPWSDQMYESLSLQSRRL